MVIIIYFSLWKCETGRSIVNFAVFKNYCTDLRIKDKAQNGRGLKGETFLSLLSVLYGMWTECVWTEACGPKNDTALGYLLRFLTHYHINSRSSQHDDARLVQTLQVVS